MKENMTDYLDLKQMDQHVSCMPRISVTSRCEISRVEIRPICTGGKLGEGGYVRVVTQERYLQEQQMTMALNLCINRFPLLHILKTWNFLRVEVTQGRCKASWTTFSIQ